MSEADVAQDFRIVGVGASAGGLEALELFFDNMPARDEFAFVVVQHLSPDYKSLMAELLAKHTDMPIFQAEDGMEVKPGSVYLIPRKKNMTVYQRKLFLTEQEHGLNLPIDIFFRSLAEECEERAIGIVLSGTGSDGTRGLRAIKEAGGLVIVQDEEDAKFNGMPRSAIATGIVDFVLPAASIPAELNNFVSGNVRLRGPDKEIESGGAGRLSKVFMLIKRKTGVDLSFYKETTILRRIERRMGINQVVDLGSYVRLLETSSQEVATLFKEILIGVTKFFRDPDAFDALCEQIVPRIFAGKASGEDIRVWVAGCSTGEEAYSIAIGLAEYAEEHMLQNEIKIFATDIDKDAIDFASYGVYPESIAADAQSKQMSKYFIRKGENYQIAPNIREMVIFAYHNVFKDPPFRNMDLISCRNLLIYLQPVLQKKVLSNFHFSLNSQGHLFLGSSETVGDLASFFRTVDSRWKLFASKEGSYKPTDLSITTPDFRWREHLYDVNTRVEIGRNQRAADPVYEHLIEEYLPPCVIVDEQRQIVHIFGDVNPYLRLPFGRVDLDVIKMARTEVAIPLGNGLQQAIRDGDAVTFDQIAFQSETGEYQSIRLRIRPLPGTRGTGFYAVLFDDRQTPDPHSNDRVVPFDIDENVKQRIADLESELKQTREHLQATIEELETSNEELQATNEELLSSNEELQSTNEELQSVNEELITVNSEYQKKIEELSELNDDMDNLLSGTAIGTVFLDEDLNIRKFTPPVAGQVNIIRSDVGRPFGDLSHNLLADDLISTIRAVRDDQQSAELELESRDGKWFLIKIQPYRSETDSLRGIVLSLVDISERKSAELALLRQHELLMGVLDSNMSAVLILDHHGCVIYANKPAEALIGSDQAGLTGRALEDDAFAFTDANGKPIPRDQLPFALLGKRADALIDFRARMKTADGKREIAIHANPIYDERGTVTGAVLSLG